MTVKNSSDVVELLKSYRFKKQEHFGIICLDSGYNVISKKVLFKGGVDGALVYKNILYWEMCKKSASAIIIFHNHPGGNVLPSKEDIATTQDIENGCNLLGISLLDHVIVSKHRYYSFKEHDKIGNTETETKAVAEKEN